MKSILLLVLLAALAVSVLCVSVDVTVNVGSRGEHHRGSNVMIPTVNAGSANPRCDQVSGTCQVGCDNGEQRTGLCNGPTNFKCCIRNGNNNPPAPASGDCGPYANSQRFQMTKNDQSKVTVTKVAREHLTDPSIYNVAPTAKDNSISIPTACAFNKMWEAAKSAGVSLTISSAFRTYERQQYFWNCYQTKSCNNGNLAARPGRSNHGMGIALDLNATSRGAAQYRWLASNAQRFGFVRTVPTETWHWEYRAGAPKASYT
jgi:hypothetical protein